MDQRRVGALRLKQQDLARGLIARWCGASLIEQADKTRARRLGGGSHLWLPGLATTAARLEDASPAPINHPFDLAPLLIFSSMLTAIVIFSGCMMSRIGSRGLLVTSALVSLADVDVAAMTAARLGGSTVDAARSRAFFCRGQRSAHLYQMAGIGDRCRWWRCCARGSVIRSAGTLLLLH